MNMTSIPGVPSRDQIRPGMAFYIGSGPKGTICGNCKNFGYYDEHEREWYEKRCGQYRKMTGNHGPVIDSGYRSCKYFETKS
jgi:hypothetical protein